MNDMQVAKGLGLFSLGLGATQLVAPGWLGRKIGVGEPKKLMRVLGAREIAAGVGVLREPNPSRSLWARFGGDIMDLALLGLALRRSFLKRRVSIAIGLVAGVTLLDALYAKRLQG